MDNEGKYFTELALAMAERTTKRLWILCIIMFIALVLSNVCWFIYENSFEDVTTTVTQESSSDLGDAIINDGVHINDESETDSN